MAEFTGEDPEGLAGVTWGDAEIGGYWREIVTGLRFEIIRAEGVLRLRRVSLVGILNDGLM
jgi:hypothetical protein